MAGNLKTTLRIEGFKLVPEHQHGMLLKLLLQSAWPPIICQRDQAIQTPDSGAETAGIQRHSTTKRGQGY